MAHKDKKQLTYWWLFGGCWLQVRILGRSLLIILHDFDTSASRTRVGSGAVQKVMPRFANTEKARKRSSDILHKLQRLLTASRSRHNELQRENQQLQLEFHLLKSFCEGLGKLFLFVVRQCWEVTEATTTLENFGLLCAVRHASVIHGCGSDVTIAIGLGNWAPVSWFPCTTCSIASSSTCHSCFFDPLLLNTPVTAEWLHQQTANQLTQQKRGSCCTRSACRWRPAQQQCRPTLPHFLQGVRLPAGKRTTAAAQQCRRWTQIAVAEAAAAVAHPPAA
jgi:hypothetical protein